MTRSTDAHPNHYSHRTGLLSWLRQAVVCTVLVLAVMVASSAHSGASNTDPESTRQCIEQVFSVSLAPDTAADQSIFARVCTPVEAVSNTVMLLQHGITYDHRYFDIPDFDGKYSYAESAARSGYATVAIDRIGSGRSSHPLSTQIGMNSNAWIAHQIVGKLRGGDYVSPDGSSTPFARVVSVGHSYGSVVAWFEASKYADVDALIITGASHSASTAALAKLAGGAFTTAQSDPSLGRPNLDPGYLTVRPGMRYDGFMRPGNVDPKLIAWDDSVRGTLTLTEYSEAPVLLASTLEISVPVLLAMGEDDGLFCANGVCKDERTLLAAETPHLGEPPCSAAYIQPGAGHNNVYMHNVSDLFAAMNSWARATVNPDGQVSAHCAAFDPESFKTIEALPSPEIPLASPLINAIPDAPIDQFGEGLVRILTGAADQILPALP